MKLFYARDFRALMLKFGKLALVDELSGTPGQVVPTRPLEDGPANTRMTNDCEDDHRRPTSVRSS